MSRKYFIICLVCAFWTVLQTSFHLVFVIYSYYLGTCETSPKDLNSIFYYLTYLYNSNCDKPKLEVNALSLSSPESYVIQFIKTMNYENDTISLEEIVPHLLEKLDFFPNNAASSSRTLIFLLCFIILDATWIVTAVALIMGTSFGIKETLSLVFYGPWIVVTICVAIFDGLASSFFGFDTTNTDTFADWLTFVGITDSYAFPDYDSKGITLSLTTAPSVALCCVSSRFIIIWIANWIALIFVIKATISVYKESYKNERVDRLQRPRTFIDSSSQRNRIDNDNSAARIRNWQIFYGAIDTTSTHSSKSVESEKDLNSNNHKENKSELSESIPETPNASTYYYAYPDVAESVFIVDGAACLDELRGQLPWSYTQPQDKIENTDERIEMEKIGKKYRFKSDSSSSGTEL